MLNFRFFEVNSPSAESFTQEQGPERSNLHLQGLRAQFGPQKRLLMLPPFTSRILVEMVKVVHANSTCCSDASLCSSCKQ